MNGKKINKFKVFPGGVVIAYIGDGKGKTTAAIGTAVRARGYSKQVLFFQFLKTEDWPSGERVALKKLGIRVVIAGRGFIGILGDTKKKSEHKAAAKKALQEARKYIRSERFSVIVLDEVISAVEEGLLTQKDVVSLIQMVKRLPQKKQPHLILTGHRKYPTILKHCDLITEMKNVKHPYYKGFLAIKGIDF